MFVSYVSVCIAQRPIRRLTSPASSDGRRDTIQCIDSTILPWNDFAACKAVPVGDSFLCFSLSRRGA